MGYENLCNRSETRAPFSMVARTSLLVLTKIADQNHSQWFLSTMTAHDKKTSGKAATELAHQGDGHQQEKGKENELRREPGSKLVADEVSSSVISNLPRAKSLYEHEHKTNETQAVLLRVQKLAR